VNNKAVTLENKNETIGVCQARSHHGGHGQLALPKIVIPPKKINKLHF